MEKEYTQDEMLLIEHKAREAAMAVKVLLGTLGFLEADGSVPVGSDLKVVSTYYTLLEIAHSTEDFAGRRIPNSITFSKTDW